MTQEVRIKLRIAKKDEQLFERAAACQQRNLAKFVARNAVSAAREIVERDELIAAGKSP
jgi:uncharacterized protein (DUF1778 family)